MVMGRHLCTVTEASKFTLFCKIFKLWRTFPSANRVLVIKDGLKCSDMLRFWGTAFANLCAWALLSCARAPSSFANDLLGLWVRSGTALAGFTASHLGDSSALTKLCAALGGSSCLHKSPWCFCHCCLKGCLVNRIIKLFRR